MTETRESGVVATWFLSRAYGFIRPDDPAADDVFCHLDQILADVDHLVVGQAVTFVRATGAKGVYAADVQVVD